METLLLPTLLVLVGFALLAWSADLFVTGAAAFANNLGISPILIGLTVVGLGTSAPEIIVACLSSFQGKPDIAMGNAFGSNIANVALILGITALLVPIKINKTVCKQELPILLVVTFFTIALFLNGYLSRLDGVLLLAALVAVLYWIKRQNSGANGEQSTNSEALSIDFADDWFNHYCYWHKFARIGCIYSRRA